MPYASGAEPSIEFEQSIVYPFLTPSPSSYSFTPQHRKTDGLIKWHAQQHLRLPQCRDLQVSLLQLAHNACLLLPVAWVGILPRAPFHPHNHMNHVLPFVLPIYLPTRLPTVPGSKRPGQCLRLLFRRAICQLEATGTKLLATFPNWIRNYLSSGLYGFQPNISALS